MHQGSIILSTVSLTNELQQILQLQQKNLPQNISKTEAITQGFVTVEHTFDLLKQMHDVEPAVIAKDGDKVIGYALVMTKEFGKAIPVLFPMFEMFEKVDYQNRKLAAHNYFVMGQVCIDKDYRGIGLFDKLYQKLKEQLSSKFDIMITEVASRNARSIQAHKKSGLQTVHIYADAQEEVWEIMVWDLKSGN
ncbi:MAG: GNAT family N-acetyltransferase [Chitinophagales bacterium]|nr:GNAT family N-acetyltransferase [Chitinophagales bacterium]